MLLHLDKPDRIYEWYYYIQAHLYKTNIFDMFCCILILLDNSYKHHDTESEHYLDNLHIFALEY
jgi:hypothetical protein